MKIRYIAVALVLCLALGIGGIPINKEVKALENKQTNKIEKLESNLTNLNLEGFVGKSIQDNVEKWQLTALENNPNIVEEISRAAKKQVNFNSLITDYFGSKKHYKVEQDNSDKGFIGKSVKFTYYNKATSFNDIDMAIGKDVSVNTDCRGAQELWCYVNATEFGNQKVPMRLNFEEGDPTTGTRESWTPKSNISVYTIKDGATIRQEQKTVADGFVELEAGFKGWVCYPLSAQNYNKYWSSGVSNGVMDLSDVHQFMFCLKANDTALDKSFYIDAFSIVGDDLLNKSGVIGLPLDVAGLNDKQFRQLWSVDYPSNFSSYEGGVMPWYGEFVGKLLTGMVYSYKLTGSSELKAKIIETVDQIEAAQGDDGYLGTYINGRFSVGADNWDMWNHYHIIYGLYSWYKVSGDERCIDISMRALDYLIEYIKTNNNNDFIPMGGWEMNMAIGHAMAMIYNETKEERYLNACKQMIDKDWNRAGNWYNDFLEGKDFFQSKLHRWESLHPITMFSTLYEATGEKKYFDAFEHFWYSIAKTDRHNTGAFSSGEGAKGTPYLSGAGAEIETCCTISWMAMSTEYYQMSKNPYVIDELELSFFNGMLGSLMEDHKYVTYNTPMVATKTLGYDGRKQSSQTDITFQWNSGSPEFNCCQANAARGLAQLSEWGVVTDSENLYVNYYGPSKAQTLTPSGNNISIKQTTIYPENGKIVIEIGDLAKEETFALNLRIPTWSKQSLVKLNDNDVVSAQSGKYYTINKKWKNGDKITIDLDVSPHFWAGEETFDGYTSAYYGPILMTMDQKTTPENTMFNTVFEDNAFDDVVVSSGADNGFWLYFDVKDKLGNVVRLVDFASAGKFIDNEPGCYYSWLKINSEGLDIMPAGRDYPPVWQNMLERNITIDGDTIEVVSLTAKGGELVNFGLNIPENKEVDKITVKTSKGDIVYEGNDGGYSFVMPNNDVNISVTYKNKTKENSGCGSIVNVQNVAQKIIIGGMLIGLLTLFIIPKRKATKK